MSPIHRSKLDEETSSKRLFDKSMDSNVRDNPQLFSIPNRNSEIPSHVNRMNERHSRMNEAIKSE